MVLTTAVKHALRRIGLDIVRYMPPVGRPFPVLPLLVRERLTRNEPCVVLQIGANDGISADPLREVLLAHDLSGLLVEPLPEMFAALLSNYANRPNLRFENAAIGMHDGGTPFYRLRPGTPAPRYWYDIAGFDRSLLLSHGIPAAAIETIIVPTLTMTGLLAKHALPHVDLLQVDTEGHDGVIVRSALAAGLRPAIINYESCHLTCGEQVDLKRLLVEYGYRFLDIARDTLAVRPATG